MYTLHDFFADATVLKPPPYSKKVNIVFNPDKPNLKPGQHQVSGLRLALSHVRTGNYDETGSGKTIISQAFLCFWTSPGNKAVVIMPPVLLDQYAESFVKTLQGVEKYVSLHVFRQTVKRENGTAVSAAEQRERLYKEWANNGAPDILLMSYDIFRTQFRRIKELGYEVLVADEAMALKNSSSKIWKAVYEFIGKQNTKECALLLMTGTPAENTLIDLYALIKLVTPDEYRSKTMFEDAYVIRNHHSPFKEIMGYHNHEGIMNSLYRQARRVLKKDVMDLPSKLITEIPVQLEGWHRKLYKRLVDERMLELPDGGIVDAIQAQALYQALQRIIFNPGEFGGTGEHAPMKAVDSLLESIGVETHKVIIFAHYRSTVESLAGHYKELKPAVLYGGSTGRSKQIKAFKEGEQCRLLIANIKSAGVGLNLQDTCSHVIFTEAVSVPGQVFQAIDRVHRPGQTVPVNVYMLTVLDTVSVTIRNKLISKEAENNMAVGDKKTLLTDLLGSRGLVGRLS